MGDERTISIEVEEGRGRRTTRHFNVDNVAYLDVEGREAKSKASLLVGIVVLVLSLGVSTVFVVADGASLSGLFLPSLIGAVGVLLIAYHFVDENDGIELGTVTGNTRIDLEDPTDLETQFVERSLNTITMTGTEDRLLSSISYRYHFVPDNIVSVQRQQTAVTLTEWAIILGVTVPPLAFAYVATMKPLRNTMIALVPCGILGALLYFGFSRKDDGVVIELRSGETRSFVMSSDDARSVLNEFGNR